MSGWSKINHQLELVSIHIPKTGGTSFQLFLEKEFGRSNFMRLDFSINDNTNPPSLKAKNSSTPEQLQQLTSIGSLPRQIGVLHGHFTFSHFKRLFNDTDKPRFISWLRHPVERTISNYFYLRSQLDELITHQKNSRRLMNRLMRSLEEFARLDRQSNLYQTYLGGFGLEAFDFVGILEEAEEETRALAQMLDWKNNKQPHVNKTKQEKPVISAAERQTLEKILKGEIQVYENALRIRDRRMKNQ